ncbi:c-type cytochrome [Marinobacterium jannaschii]|uniref:c-type cytochrome n=1 Tax=Marinobacterium jannaschii TaxID=64970 RepID=UPI000487DCAA|nr:cytochrome c [Marinobacterium jannaschii]
MWRYIQTSLIFSLALIAGCGEKSPQYMFSGDELYGYYCLECHQSRGPGARLENRDHSQPPLEAHELFVLIKYGYHQRHKNLPSFPELSPRQTDRLAEYVLQLQQSTAPKQLADAGITE